MPQRISIPFFLMLTAFTLMPIIAKDIRWHYVKNVVTLQMCSIYFFVFDIPRIETDRSSILWFEGQANKLENAQLCKSVEN